MVTKKDFIAIAKIIKKNEHRQFMLGGDIIWLSKRYICRDLADYFEEQGELFNRALFLRACGDMNQCDGCCRGLPIEDGDHMKNGMPVMGCTANRYEEVTHD